MRRALAPLISILLLASCRTSEVSPIALAAPPPPAVVRSSSSPAATVAAPNGTVVAQPLDQVLNVWQEPGPGARLQTQLWSGNGFHQRIRFPVVSRFRDVGGTSWLKVPLPERPNGSTGWIRSQDVTLSRVQDRILVDLSARRLVRFRDGERVLRLRVGVGSDGYPTTTGRFFVWAKVDYPDDQGAYGAFALGLSGFSRVITDWVGGGRLAIHGTTDPLDRGRAVSHGCVRVYNPELTALIDVPMGTPVRIRP